MTVLRFNGLTFTGALLILYITIIVYCEESGVILEYDGRRNEFHNLTEALNFMKNINGPGINNIILNINNGVDILEDGFTFKNMENFTFQGNSTLISCNLQGGLHFINSTNILITKVEINNCGFNFTNYRQQETLVVWPVVFLFNSVDTITFYTVVFSNSFGTAIKLVNCMGDIVIDKMLFSESRVHIEDDPFDFVGGGSIYILQVLASSSIYISNSGFSSSRVIGDGDHTKGGAIAAIFYSAGNNLDMTDLYMNGNYAMHGSCIYVGFLGIANHNTVILHNSQIYGHKCYNSTAGSAVRYKCVGTLNIQYLLDSYDPMASYNSFTIHNVAVSKNVAYVGGAISVSARRQTTPVAHTNTFIATKVKMEYNRAQVGATIHYSDLPGHLQKSGYLLRPILQGQITNSFITNKSNVTVGQGTIYSNGMDINVIPPGLDIINSMGTAVVISGAELKVSSKTTITFSGNTGKLGGALALINQATLTVENGSNLVFDRNKANDKGGAIYLSNYYDNYVLPLTKVHCAIKFEENTSFYFIKNVADNRPNSIFATSILSCSQNQLPKELPHNQLPFCWDNWNYNYSTCENQTYTSPATIQLVMQNLTDLWVFPGFPFLLPIALIDDYSKDITNMFVVSAFIVKGEASVDSSSQYIAGGNITIYARPNSNIILAIETSEPRVVYTELSLTIKECPPGYYSIFLDKEKGTNCICGGGYRPSNVVLCNKNTASARIMVGWCMTYSRELGMGIVASWQFFSQIKYKERDGYYTLPSTVDQLDIFFCEPLKRTGRLCGNCQEGYGVPVYSHDNQCVPCETKDLARNIILYLLAELLPLTVFFAVVIIFNVSITSGPAKAFVFFSQMMTLPTVIFVIQQQIKQLVSNDWAQSIMLSFYVLPYSIWNLDFLRTVLPPFCLTPHISTIHVMVLTYISALYALVLIITVYTCIELHASNCQPVAYICMPFCRCLSRLRRNWKIRTSFIDAFATFLVLSYTKLCSVSFLLLVPNTVYSATGKVNGLKLLYLDASVEYGSTGHIWLMVLAVSVLFFIVFPLPLILLVFPSQIVQRCLNRTHLNSRALRAFMDSFQGCYRVGIIDKKGSNDMRSFSSLYFFLRIVSLAIMMTASDKVTEGLLQVIEFIAMSLLIAICQPYEKQWNNLLDIFIFSILALVNVLVLTQSASHQLNTGFVVVEFILIFAPLLYMSIYIGQAICKESKCRRKKKSLTISAIEDDSNIPPMYKFEFPDRVLNPKEYEQDQPLLTPN